MDTKHEVRYIDPLELKPYENNPRVNDYAVKGCWLVLRSLVLPLLY